MLSDTSSRKMRSGRGLHPQVDSCGNTVPRTPSPLLSKSRYLAGLQCRKLLWWSVHEPEVVQSDDREAVLDRGNLVGIAAREQVPGGVLIDVPPYKIAERVEATAAAVSNGAAVIYEASFAADGTFASVDILQRQRGGWILIEVKATLDVKDHHLTDVAFQVHCLRQAGLAVKRAEVMHLNRECRYPDLSNLFVRKDVTREVEVMARAAQRKARAFAATLGGALPKVKTGPHCTEPYDCSFMERCWGTLPRHHISTLYRIRAKDLQKLERKGYETLHDLPDDFPADGPRGRQIESVRKRRLVVAAELVDALKAIDLPVAFLDFETIAPAIPLWDGCAPYEQIPVQLSCHRLGPRGVSHREWLASGPADPRDACARAILDACEGTGTVLAYNASFEKRCIEGLMEAVPRLAKRLERVSERIVDLLPIVRDHVYHPAFNGSFSIKSVLPALVPGEGYADLEIQDGSTASAALEAMLLGDPLPPSEARILRRNLLAYCERDTLGMVRLYERLRDVAETRTSP